MSFALWVAESFDYLCSEYGFSHLERDVGYVKQDLELSFYAGNGQVDINFFIRKNDDLFKPYISRSFELASVLRSINPQALESYPKEIEGYLTDSLSIQLHLKYYARILKCHGEEILKGDLKIFEMIYQKRKECARRT